ncbi:MAG: amylo-alpha-1,6-glucosidase [Desulfovibrio sp.]|jgi:predicted glycogen debranching enzyme|nr:amylo-alpha-1,6-glucosidase [Desulfovibrio sp.]
MRFSFDKAACQNIRRALRREWLLTNGLGDYASSSILCCNARKYHGLLTVNTPFGRHVLLSTMEESISGGDKEFAISTRRHCGGIAPFGHKYQEGFTLDGWPVFTYRVGDAKVTREAILMEGASALLLRYTIRCRSDLPPLPLTLRLKPLLAYRNFHKLTHANPDLDATTKVLGNGFTLTPYPGLPPLWVQAQANCSFTPSPVWYRDVEYSREEERGYECVEDLFMPGILEIPLTCAEDVYLCVSTSSRKDPEKLWKAEAARIEARRVPGERIIDTLTEAGRQFPITTPSGNPAIIAGYHWFDAWGRDTLIALPGLTFYSGRTELGLSLLKRIGDNLHNGLVPNMFGEGGDDAYNSADAALWYAFAVQCYLKRHPDGLAWVKENAWNAIKSIIKGYRGSPGMDIYIDERGLLHAGTATTQLTWMDAQVNGRPVTPRGGCPVELNALWYNTLAFAEYLARKFKEKPPATGEQLQALRNAFGDYFWVPRGNGYLGDVWSNGILDKTIRPNQILAVSLPYPVLDEELRTFVVECVCNNLLTPYGLRTLSPDNPAYKGRYEGAPEVRDAAYHQGTVWPWLLGHYGDAFLHVTYDFNGAARALLDKILPLFTDHLGDGGLGTISEIFDGSPPHRSHGCIAQAWSVAECIRLLTNIREKAPQVYEEWEQRLAHLLAHPVSGDTAGVCRASFTPASGE